MFNDVEPFRNVICLKELKRDNEYLIAIKLRMGPFVYTSTLSPSFRSIFEAICYTRHVNKAVDGKQICESRNLF